MSEISLTSTTLETQTLPTRVDKTIAWLKQSRNTWKEKSTKAKYERKKFRFAKVRLEKQCNTLRTRASEMEDKITDLQTQLELQTHKVIEFEAELKKKEHELEAEKKSTAISKWATCLSAHL